MTTVFDRCAEVRYAQASRDDSALFSYPESNKGYNAHDRRLITAMGVMYLLRNNIDKEKINTR